MFKKNFIVIAILGLVMVGAAFAQPMQKQTRPKAAGIGGMETDFGSVVKRPRSKNWSLGASNPTSAGNNQRPSQQNGQPRQKGIGGGILGGAMIGGAFKSRAPIGGI